MSASEVKLKKPCQISEVVDLEREREKIRLDAGDQQQILHKWKTTFTLAKLTYLLHGAESFLRS